MGDGTLDRPIPSASRGSPQRGTAVVTGATSGIGYEIARIFARHGHRVLLVARSTSRLERAQSGLAQEFGASTDVVPIDLSQPNAGEMVFQRIGALLGMPPEIDFLVNSAGIGDTGRFESASHDKTLTMLSLNVVALTQLTRIVLPQMVARGRGRILNVASTAAFHPGPLTAVYSATKAYVLSFSEALASELRETGVTVTTLCPGPTETRFQRTAGSEILRSQRRRLASASDVARVGYERCMRGDGVVIHGMQNRWINRVLAWMPRAVVGPLVRRVRERSQ